MDRGARDCPVTPLLRCDPRMGATTVSSMGCHIWRRARNIPPGSNPSSNRGWPIIRNVTHIHGSCSALQNTYISSLGHDDASSVSFGQLLAFGSHSLLDVTTLSSATTCPVLQPSKTICMCNILDNGPTAVRTRVRTRRNISGPSPNVTTHRRHCSSTHPGVTAQ